MVVVFLWDVRNVDIVNGINGVVIFWVVSFFNVVFLSCSVFLVILGSLGFGFLVIVELVMMLLNLLNCSVWFVNVGVLVGLVVVLGFGLGFGFFFIMLCGRILCIIMCVLVLLKLKLDILVSV